jgi:N4-gp56 family major capsid protein
MAVGTGTSGISTQFQRYFSKELLDYIVESLQLVQFAQKAPLPAKSGSKTIRWFRFDEPSTGAIETLSTEGTKPSGERALSLENVDADLVQYGQVISITDILQLTELFSHVEQAVKVTGQDAALHADQIVRNELGGNVTGKQTRMANGLADYAAVGAASAADAVVEFNDFLDCTTQLRKNNTPMIGGNYVGVVSPEVASDLMKTSGWQNAASYSAVESLYKGEIGRLWGIRFLQTTVPFLSDGSTQHTYDSTGTVHSSFVFGQNAYGVSDVASQSPYGPSVYVTDGASKDDPLNQKTVVGYKSFYAAKTLQPKYYVEMYSKTNFS